jgi:hypothetical protein
MHLIYTPTLEEEVARKTEEFCRKWGLRDLKTVSKEKEGPRWNF